MQYILVYAGTSMGSISPHQYKWDYLQISSASKETFKDWGISSIFIQEICWRARKKPHLTFWCFVIWTIKCPKLNTRNTGFIITTTGIAHALMELCEILILHTSCSFGSGCDAFAVLCVSGTEHRLSEQAGRAAGESWDTARLLICVVAPSTRVEFPCKEPLLGKCSVQFWKTILSACDEYL